MELSLTLASNRISTHEDLDVTRSVEPVVSEGLALLERNQAMSNARLPFKIGDQQYYFLMLPKPNMSATYTNGKYRALLSAWQQESLKNRLVVCLESVEGIRRYTVFDTVEAFIRHRMQFFSNGGDFFHEVIFGAFPQKLRFDLDIKQNSEKEAEKIGKSIMTQIIDKVKTQYGLWGLTLDLTKDVIQYTSHGKDIESGKHKFSMHLVFDKYYHQNNVQVKLMAKLVIADLQPPEYKEFVDMQIYSNRHNFRIVGSPKTTDVKRVKVMDRFLDYGGVIYEHKVPCDNIFDHEFYITSHSLISNITRDMNLLPMFEIPEKQGNKTDIQIGDEIAYKAISIMIEYLGDGDTFQYAGTKDTLVLLKRTQPSLCPICDRIHDKVDPYLRVTNWQVYFNCRRSDKQLPIWNTDVSLDEVPDTGGYFQFGNKVIDFKGQISYVQEIEGVNAVGLSVKLPPSLAIHSSKEIQGGGERASLDTEFDSNEYSEVIDGEGNDDGAPAFMVGGVQKNVRTLLSNERNMGVSTSQLKNTPSRSLENAITRLSDLNRPNLNIESQPSTPEVIDDISRGKLIRMAKKDGLDIERNIVLRNQSKARNESKSDEKSVYGSKDYGLRMKPTNDDILKYVLVAPKDKETTKTPIDTNIMSKPVYGVQFQQVTSDMNGYNFLSGNQCMQFDKVSDVKFRMSSYN